MFEYQIVVTFQGVAILKTEWHVGKQEAREIAWLLASKLGNGYVVSVSERREEFKSTPWAEFGLDLLH